MNLDPLAEDYSTTSPYVFTLNNPIFFVDPDGRKIRNADEERKQQAEKDVKRNQGIVNSAESKYGTEKSSFKNKTQYKRYKQAKRDLKKSQRSVKRYASRAKETQGKIDDLKKNAPKMFAKMDNIQNQYGETVDIMMSTESMSNLNGKNDFSFDVNNTNGEVRVKTSEFGLNTLGISIDTVMEKALDGTTPTTLQTTKHEMGHASYEIENTKSYHNYIQNLKKAKKAFNGGHRSDDSSGQRAEQWQRKKDL